MANYESSSLFSIVFLISPISVCFQTCSLFLLLTGVLPQLQAAQDCGGFQQILHLCLGLCRLHPLSKGGNSAFQRPCWQQNQSLTRWWVWKGLNGRTCHNSQAEIFLRNLDQPGKWFLKRMENVDLSRNGLINFQSLLTNNLTDTFLMSSVY